MFLNDNQYFYVYLYWREKPSGILYACKSIPKIFCNFFLLFYFTCILLQISHKMFLFMNIFIPRRSGVNIQTINKGVDTLNVSSYL